MRCVDKTTRYLAAARPDGPAPIIHIRCGLFGSVEFGVVMLVNQIINQITPQESLMVNSMQGNGKLLEKLRVNDIMIVENRGDP